MIPSNAKSEVWCLIDIVDIENKYGVVQSSTKVFAKYCHALVFVEYFPAIMKLSWVITIRLIQQLKRLFWDAGFWSIEKNNTFC